MKKILISLLILLLITLLTAKKYPLRKYYHVKKFYKEISKVTVDLGVKYNTPPAAVLAIAGLESGYGTGYVSQVTGNIMSLGANKGERQLPPLYLPRVKKTKKIIFKKSDITKYKKNQLKWAKRPPSLKKDYRPSKIVGTANNLEYFSKHPNERKKAMKKNIEDFMKNWVSYDYQMTSFQEARAYLDSLVSKKGKDVLFDKEVNIGFIELIGGRPHSFNYRKSWLRRVKSIMNNTGLIDLTVDIYFHNKNFDTAWKK